MPLTDQELLHYNRRGLIPGPEETEEAFLQRIERSENVFVDAPRIPKEDWKEVYALTEQLYNFTPDWITAFYSDRELPFWQAAATWIDGSIPMIQLKTPFQSGSYHKLYSRSEVLAHEAVHAARTAFNEPRFEELFAYKTSKRFIHRWIGPFFKRSWESYAFLFSLPLFITPFFLAPLGMLALGGIRLGWSHWLLDRCARQLKKVAADPLPFLFRLTDKEIVLFGKMAEEEIRQYLLSHSSLRAKVLQLAYLSACS